MAGAVPGSARRPVDAESDRLGLHRALGPLPPTDGLPSRGRQRRDQLLDAIARGRARLARLAVSLIGRDLVSCCLHLLRQAHPKGAFHGADVGHLTSIESLQEVGIVAVARVDHTTWTGTPQARARSTKSRARSGLV